MKIIAIIEKPITSGGGFNQALNAIQQMSRLSVDKFDFSVVTPAKENIDSLKRLNIKTDYVAITFFDKILSRLFPGRIWGQILAKLKDCRPI